MRTNQVSADIMVSQPNTANNRESKNTGTGSGFSDILGNVSADSRRQPGLSGSSSRGASDTNGSPKEFRFTETASGRVLTGPISDNGQNPAQTEFIPTAQRFREEAADMVLTTAAETVARQVFDSGIPPKSKENAAEMMLGVLRNMKNLDSVKFDGETVKPDEAVTEEESFNDLLETVIRVMEGITDRQPDELSQNAFPVQRNSVTDGNPVRLVTADMPAMVAVKHDEAAMITGSASGFDEGFITPEEMFGVPDFTAALRMNFTDEQLSDGGENVFAEDEQVMTAMQDMPDVQPVQGEQDHRQENVQRFPQNTAQQEEQTEGYTVRSGGQDNGQPVIRPVMRELTREADSGEDTEQPAERIFTPDEQPERNAQQLIPDRRSFRNEIRLAPQEDNAPDRTQPQTKDIPEITGIPAAPAENGEYTPAYEISYGEEEVPEVPETITTRVSDGMLDEASDNMPDLGETDDFDKIFADAGKLFGRETVNVSGPNVEAVKATAKLLGEIITDAKKELGLSEISIQTVSGNAAGEEEHPFMPMTRNDHITVSRQMMRTDRTGELDHIMGTRNDTRGEDAPDTETYDAVHMSSELLSSAAKPEIPVHTEYEFRDEFRNVRPPEVQLTEQILDRIENMQGDRTEFTMVLNPESLGRITVKLVMTGEKTAVEVTAENPGTRELLASRSEALQNMLKQSGVDLERYQVVSEQEDAQFRQQSYDGSSKNPYHRQEGGRQDSSGSDDEDSGEEPDSGFYDLLGRM